MSSCFIQSIITVIVNFSSIKILLHCFFGSVTSSYLCFLWSEWYFIVIFPTFLWSIPSFHLTAILHCYLLLILYHFIHTFLCFVNLINIVHSTKVSGFFNSSFISLCFLNTSFTETNSSWLIHQSVKVLEIRISIVFKLAFPNKTVSSCYFFFFLII